MQKESKWTVLDTQVPKTLLYTDIFKVLLAWWNVSKVNICYDNVSGRGHITLHDGICVTAVWQVTWDLITADTWE